VQRYLDGVVLAESNHTTFVHTTKYMYIHTRKVTVLIIGYVCQWHPRLYSFRLQDSESPYRPSSLHFLKNGHAALQSVADTERWDEELEHQEQNIEWEIGHLDAGVGNLAQEVQ